MARNKKPLTAKLDLRISEEALGKLDAKATRKRKSIGALVRDIIDNYFEPGTVEI